MMIDIKLRNNEEQRILLKAEILNKNGYFLGIIEDYKLKILNMDSPLNSIEDALNITLNSIFSYNSEKELIEAEISFGKDDFPTITINDLINKYKGILTFFIDGLRNSVLIKPIQNNHYGKNSVSDEKIYWKLN